MERNDLRARTLKAIKDVKWMPAWGDERMSNMIATRPDWCISRQRVWGVPIIVFYCENCQEPMTDRKVLDRVVELFRRAHRRRLVRALGRRAGWSRSCLRALRRARIPQRDRYSRRLVRFRLQPPCSADSRERLALALQHVSRGGDQYRGWFHSSLLVGVALKGAAPYRECATNGWTLDEQGRAMSKSLGIGVEPEEVISKFGADVLRLWVSSVDFVEDVRLSDTILKRLSEAYVKFRNNIFKNLSAI